MRVLYLSADPGVPVLGHKGASVHVREMVAALHRAGARVTLASPRLAPEGDCLDVPVTAAPIPPVLPKEHRDADGVRAAARAQAASLVQIAREARVDAIYERFSLYSAAGARAAWALGIPHVVEVNAPLRDEAARFRTLPHPEVAAELERVALDDADHVFAVSEPLARRLRAEGAGGGRVAVLANAVDPARFASPVRDPSRFVVGFAGSLKPWHGIEVLAEAIARTPGVELEVVGHGPCREPLDRIAGDRVRLLGTLPHQQAVAAMARWDVGVAPYLPLEDFWFSPLKVLEYMAAGCCTVASDLGDCAAVLGHDARGVLVPPADPAALAGALQALAADRERAWALGCAAREWVLAERTWDRAAVDVLQALAAQPAERAA
jgi:glycosyltransferase involved in cell wall biosynthesis